MNITVVGNRNGRAVIYWPGVLLAALIVAGSYSIGVAALSLALGWFSILSMISLPFVLGAIIGRGIKAGLRQPPLELPVFS